MYRQMEMHFPGVREVWQYHDQRCGAPGQKRKKRGKEARDIRNQRQKERKCRWRLRQYFRPGDSYITLTCRKDERPEDMTEMKARWTAFIKAIRKVYKKDDVPFRWIRNIEVGSKGAWHIHLVLPSLDRNMSALAADAWPWGRAKVEAMYGEGRFGDLAAYLTKSPRTDRRLVESDHASSRNMPVQAPIEKTMTRWPTFEGQDIKMVPKGWYVDPNSIEEYLTPCGFPVRRYQLLMIGEPEEDKTRAPEPPKKRRRRMVNPDKIRIPDHSTEPPPEEPGEPKEAKKEAKKEGPKERPREKAGAKRKGQFDKKPETATGPPADGRKNADACLH